MSTKSLLSAAQDISDALWVQPQIMPAATFAVGGRLPLQGSEYSTQQSPSHSIVLRWDSLDPGAKNSSTRISFPMDGNYDASLKQLALDTQPATPGQGEEQISDLRYWDAYKLPATAFSTNFSPSETSIINAVCRLLLPSSHANERFNPIRVELQSLNVYSGPSGKIKPCVVDPPRSMSHVGSLVVCLPSEHEGGEFTVRHGAHYRVHDWAKHSTEPLIQWAAFYSSCHHEVSEVRSGHLITLMYNLYAPQDNALLNKGLGIFNPTTLPIYQLIQDLVATERFQSKDRLLGFYCAHEYPNTADEAILPSLLKGIDLALYGIWKGMGFNLRLFFVGKIQEDPSYPRARFSDDENDPEDAGQPPHPQETEEPRKISFYDHRCKTFVVKPVAPFRPGGSIALDSGDEPPEHEFISMVDDVFGTDEVHHREVIWFNNDKISPDRLQMVFKIDHEFLPESWTRPWTSKLAIIVEVKAKAATHKWLSTKVSRR